MCQDCNQALGTEWRRGYLGKYLADLETRRKASPDDPDLAGEIQRTRELLATLDLAPLDQEPSCSC